jgi:hypothetical protein
MAGLPEISSATQSSGSMTVKPHTGLLWVHHPAIGGIDGPGRVSL